MRIQVLLLALTLCAISAQSENKINPLEALSNSSNNFGRDLLEALSTSYKAKNLIYSPLSIFTLLTMLLPGTGGKTTNQMFKSLHMPKKISYRNMTSFIKDFNNANDVILEIANKIYISESFSVNDTFLNMTRNVYQSEAQKINFGKSSDAANTINKWVEDKTHQKIKNLVVPSSINRDTAMFLISAIYFNGKWAVEFKKHPNTTFYTNKNNKIVVPFVSVKQSFCARYLENLEANFVRIPYLNTDFEMVVILPKRRDGLSKLEGKLKTFNYNDLDNCDYDTTVNLTMPKFKFETTVNLKDSLTQLGLGDLFTSPDFSGISKQNFALSGATQKAFIEVNEEGTEAAAATLLEITNKSPIPDAIRDVLVDHPFHLIIRKSSTVLFQGHVYDPRN